MLCRGIVALALLLAGGCGDGGEPARFTKDDITARITEAMVAEGTMHMSMQATGGGQSIEVEGDQAFGEHTSDYEMYVRYRGPDGTFRIRVVDGIIYADLAEMTGGKFLWVDPAAPDGPMGEAMAPFLEELDVATSVGQFERAITKVERKGDSVMIDGARTDPYAVTIDVDRAIESGGLDEDAGLRPGTRVTYTFFIDDADLLRRMESRVAGGQVRIDMSQFGAPVEIEAPSAAEVVKEQDLAAG